MSKKTLIESIESDGMTGLISGAIAVAGASLVYGVPVMEPIGVMGINVPMGLVIGGGVALSVSTMKFLHDELIDKIPALSSTSNMLGRIAPPIVAGLTTYGIFRVGVSSDTSLTNSMMIGTLSAITGEYASETLYKSYI
jgi:hypothetical protein